MDNLHPPPTNASRAELEALLAQVDRLARTVSAASRLATDVRAQLSAVLGIGDGAPPIVWLAGTPQTPASLETAFPTGSGELWYVVIRGLEPGMYRTADELDFQTRGVPNQFGQKKTSRREALAFYSEHYHAEAPALGVQKWTEAPPSSPAA
ncbi:hypothetical protein DFH07DRAFT_958290 [Mycena maculata]|uniref:Uncharacterized protein n=1 Tax=Mycena maculata TaxID=230809 RepID=A0AAD7NEA4_9AGAR|nr:hypothetical protein DFH07DRAFT_958290 [Mycena maculata]